MRFNFGNPLKMTEAKKSKAKKLTSEQATREVYQLFCRGLTPDQISEHARVNKWGLTERVLADVIERATERLVKTAEVLNLDSEVGKALGRLESLYQAAVTAKETKTALAVQKEINALLRLRDRVRHNERSVPATDKTATGPRRIKFVA
jgi:hypothetical protein